MKVRTLLAVVALVAAGAAIAGWSTQAAKQAELDAAIERSLLWKWAQEETGLRREAAGAGISMLRPEVEPLDRRRLGPLADTDDFHAYFHRCTSCHTAPDPSMHPPAAWRGVVFRMAGHMEKAGVLPLEPVQREAVIRFLQRAAARRGGS